MTRNTVDGTLSAVGGSLQRLRHDIAALVDQAAQRPDAQTRAALVDVHHQLRLLGQRLNTALGAPTGPSEAKEQTSEAT